MTSYKTEVIADGSGKWTGNLLRFATKAEAEEYAKDLEWRWTSVRQTRVVACDDPMNTCWDQQAQRLASMLKPQT